MTNHIAGVTTKSEPLPNISEALMQARHIQFHIKERIADGQLPESNRPAWVEIIPGSVLVPVISWIE